ncbi:hypothetical protein BDP81DRAFT_446414 [Colletotrichum phormii]|uniref:Uncharacterized protein n=1 Tax=Colletotrichum phormii TaxID=359342 RepID=A0AAI9ZXK3_9PEZI|nr:uncharacterized protein BDP81DRAFT_446414 [Colletotrichum phormii]KAK1640021.1 hypothetical protein BDP81DRAFT_446414 [Colletotrichum phormii]
MNTSHAAGSGYRDHIQSNRPTKVLRTDLKGRIFPADLEDTQRAANTARAKSLLQLCKIAISSEVAAVGCLENEDVDQYRACAGDELDELGLEEVLELEKLLELEELLGVEVEVSEVEVEVVLSVDEVEHVANELLRELVLVVLELSVELLPVVVPVVVEVAAVLLPLEEVPLTLLVDDEVVDIELKELLVEVEAVLEVLLFPKLNVLLLVVAAVGRVLVLVVKVGWGWVQGACGKGRGRRGTAENAAARRARRGRAAA